MDKKKFIFLSLLGILLVDATWANNCTRNSTLVDYSAELSMQQHQLRGIINVLDDCSFKVSEFDMIQGSDNVQWWGSISDDFDNLTKGFEISDIKLNKTYRNDSFVVKLYGNVSWENVNVVSVWDKPTASDFGHAVLRKSVEGGDSGVGVAPAPSWGPENVGRVYEEATMFENCRSLSEGYRLRWTLRPEMNVIDIGLEAVQGTQDYMAFGWGDPALGSENGMMYHADVAVTGFTEDGIPFAEDYYITKYSECLLSKDDVVEGVCPDTIYARENSIRFVNNTKLIYGHRKDGVSFVRYQRPLESDDKKYDVHVKLNENMTVIWALGLISPPDTLHPYYLPINHGGPRLVQYGNLILDVSEHVNECLGPLEAEDREDQDLVIADGKTSLDVVSGPALHYPNPPNPNKVIYINKKEAPVLRVERGVPVTFSIKAGHDVALYITSDPIGGNATSRNMSEVIFAGGPEAEGVPASPYDLIWSPDRNTPDQVYYHSLYEPKMGWKVQVVDGGLSDMYNNIVVLDDQQVTFFWTVTNTSISIAARGEKKSGYLAIAFGNGMVNSYAYVGWVDDSGIGHVNTYYIDGQDAMNIHPTDENLTYVRCKSESGIITFEFTRPLKPVCGDSNRPECNNIIDGTTPLKVVWAMGARWSDDHLSESNMHSVTSSRAIRVQLLRGSAEADEDLRPVLAVHGFMMFVAWGILLPGGVLAARYLKHLKGDEWYRIHVYLQYSGLTIVFLGFTFVVAELQGLIFSSVHVKFGYTAILLACAQPLNAYLRPNKPSNGEEVSRKRRQWEYLHIILGRSAIVVGMAALVSGMRHLGVRYGDENVQGLIWALIVWFLVVALIAVYLEYLQTQRLRRERSFGKSNWVLGNMEDDSIDLLHSKRSFQEENHDALSSDRMEIQLEPLSR